jgi:hypothetical protein
MRMLFAALLEFDISQMRSPATSVLLPLSGEKRKSIRQGQTDAIDPYATFGLISVWGQLCAISFSPAGGKVLGFGYRTKAWSMEDTCGAVSSSHS